MWQTLLGPLADLADTVLKRVLPAEKMSEAERAAVALQVRMALLGADDAALQTRMSAILAEAKSADPWTSRARPSFLYVIYLMILASIPMGITAAIAPDAAAAVAAGMRAWLGAIPDMLWGTFGAGYLGYSAARSFDKGQVLKGHRAK